jgi:hypothetical protein
MHRAKKKKEEELTRKQRPRRGDETAATRTPRTQKNSKSAASNNKTYTSVVVAQTKILSFHTGEIPEFTKQCLQQGHGWIQPIKARPWAFTLKLATLYSRSTFKNAVHMCCHPLAKAVAANLQHPTHMSNVYCKS